MKKPTRGTHSVADLRANSRIDPVTGCWHWLGAKAAEGTPRIWAFDPDKGEKCTISGPRAVFCIAHGHAPRPGWLAFRSCQASDCVNPVHVDQARSKADIGLHIRRMGTRKGTAVEARRANVLKAQIASGSAPIDVELVRAIRNAPKVVTGVELCMLLGLNRTTVSNIRTGRRQAGVV